MIGSSCVRACASRAAGEMCIRDSPYAFLAVPITTAMFTELADMQAEGDAEGVKRGIIGGTNQILFFMIPFALYLMVFALPLVTLYHAGAFTMDNVNSIATYMTCLLYTSCRRPRLPPARGHP